jgi:hypothetical protein
MVEVDGIADFLFFTGVSCGAASAALSLIFRTPEMNILYVSSLEVLRRPERYVQKPYARIVQLLGYLALILGSVALSLILVFGLIRRYVESSG